MKTNVVSGKGLLSVVVTGEFSFTEAKNSFLDIVDAVAQNRSEKVLFDGRQITGNPEVIERFIYGQFTAETCRNVLYRMELYPNFAYVLEKPVLDPGRFGEMVAANRGMLVKAFESLEEALGWLEFPQEEYRRLREKVL